MRRVRGAWVVREGPVEAGREEWAYFINGSYSKKVMVASEDF